MTYLILLLCPTGLIQVVHCVQSKCRAFDSVSNRVLMAFTRNGIQGEINEKVSKNANKKAQNAHFWSYGTGYKEMRLFFVNHCALVCVLKNSCVGFPLP